MRAVIINAPYGTHNVQVVDRPRPASPAPDQVLIRVVAGSPGFRDIIVISGIRVQPPSGRILGCEATAYIEDVGASVSRFKKGDRVIPTFLPGWIDGLAKEANLNVSYGSGRLDGFFQEYMLVDPEHLVLAPTNLSDIEAATLTCVALTVWHALFVLGKVTPGETLLVEGTGGISIWGLLLGRLAGLKVIVTSSSDSKLELAKKLGAWETINYRTHPAWHEEVLRLTGGVDYLFDIGGTNETLEPALQSVAVGGTLYLMGGVNLDGPKADTHIDIRLIDNNVRIQEVLTGSRKMLEDLVAFVEQHDIHPVIAQTFSDPKEAFEYVANQKAVGKVVFTF